MKERKVPDKPMEGEIAIGQQGNLMNEKEEPLGRNIRVKIDS